MALVRHLGVTDILAIVIVLGEWTGLARALIGAPLYAAALDVVLVVLAAVVFVRAMRARFPKLAIVPVVLIGAYMTLALVEILNPNVPSLRVGLEGYRKTAFTMLAFFVVALHRDASTEAARRFFTIVAVGSVPALMWAARQFIAPLPIEEQIVAGSGVSPITFHAGAVLRAFAPTAGPFHLGVLTAGLVVVGLVMSQGGRQRRWLALAALSAVVLAMTITRSNLVALLGALVLVTVFAHGSERLRTGGLAAALGALAIVGMFAAGEWVPSTAGPGTPTESPAPSAAPGASPGATPAPGPTVPPTPGPSGFNPLDQRNLLLRFEYWQEFAKAVAERPIFGYGTSAAADGFKDEYEGTGSTMFQPHSLYFKAALELGLGGLVLLVGILAWAAVAAIRLARTERWLGLTVGGILAVIGISGITGPMLDAYPINAFFWASVGWLAAAAVRQPVDARASREPRPGQPGSPEPAEPAVAPR